MCIDYNYLSQVSEIMKSIFSISKRVKDSNYTKMYWGNYYLHVCVCVCVCALNLVQLFVTPRTGVCQAPSSIEFFRQENEWVAISYSRGSFQPRNRNHISRITAQAGGFFITETPGKPTLT